MNSHSDKTIGIWIYVKNRDPKTGYFVDFRSEKSKVPDDAYYVAVCWDFKRLEKVYVKVAIRDWSNGDALYMYEISEKTLRLALDRHWLDLRILSY